MRSPEDVHRELLQSRGLVPLTLFDPHNLDDCYEPTGLDEFHPNTTRNP